MTENQTNNDTRPRDDSGRPVLQFNGMGGGSKGGLIDDKSGSTDGGDSDRLDGATLEFKEMDHDFESELNAEHSDQKTHLLEHYTREDLDSVEEILFAGGSESDLKMIADSGLANSKTFVDAVAEFAPQLSAIYDRHKDVDLSSPGNADLRHRIKSEVQELVNKAVQAGRTAWIQKHKKPLPFNLDLSHWGR